jgi:hypothetical protein
MHHIAVMKMHSLIPIAAIALATIAPTTAEVLTFQGSTRWSTTLFTPETRTAQASTSYITYYVVEQSQGNIVDTVKIDAYTDRLGRHYYIDEDFNIEYGFFGLGGFDAAGGMEVTGLSAVLPFRGTIRFGDLNAFSLYTTADYYKEGANLDITTITGSARLNTFFSGNVGIVTAVDVIADYLERRGYRRK